VIAIAGDHGNLKIIYKAKHEIIDCVKIYNDKGEEFLCILDGADIVIIGKDFVPRKIVDLPWSHHDKTPV